MHAPRLTRGSRSPAIIPDCYRTLPAKIRGPAGIADGRAHWLTLAASLNPIGTKCCQASASGNFHWQVRGRVCAHRRFIEVAASPWIMDHVTLPHSSSSSAQT